ncbi:MAG: hypothetical protein ABIG44_11035 [Planctomycetota bacterium]
MNPREKILATCLVGVLTLAGLGMVVRWAVVKRWQDLHNEIRTTAQVEQDLRNRLKAARVAEERWAEFKPLSHNTHRAEQRFRQDISELLERHGMGEDVTIRALPARMLKSQFTEVRLSVQAHGHVNQLVGYLCDFYRRTYLARLEQLNIIAEDQRKGGRRILTRGSSRMSRGHTQGTPLEHEEVMLNINMTLTALVLPLDPDLEQGIATETEYPPGEPGRLPRESEEYDPIVATNIFQVWREQPKQVVRTTTQQAREVAVNDTPREIEPPPSRPDKILIGVTSTNKQLIAYVRDNDRLDLPPAKLRVNDPIDDGTLMLVHPRGMVVQVQEQSSNDFEFKYYFYKLGTLFSEREELDPDRFPEIHQQLELFLVP